MEIMSKEEVLRLLELGKSTTIWDFIVEDPDGREVIDIRNPRADGRTGFIKSMTSVNGKLVAIGLCNGQKACNGGYVYLIRSENGLVKIGQTDNIQRRYYALNAASSTPLELIGYIETAAADPLEREFHERYADKRVRGEWFRLTDEDIQTILHLKKCRHFGHLKNGET